MKIAYLILAHGNYKHLERLINALQGEGVDFYIHIDKKSELPFINGSNIFYTQKREKVYWSTFSESKATLILLKESSKQSYYRYVLLSGADYPIRPVSEIKNVLSSEKEFISCVKWPNQYHVRSYFKYYHFDNFNRKSEELKRKFFLKAEKILKTLKVHKKIPFTIYTGNQWFALTHDLVMLVLKEIELNTVYINFFKTARFTSESFFQTIIGNLKLPESDFKMSLTFSEFINGTPVMINENNFENARNTHCLFARKFNDSSDSMIAYIEQIIKP